MTSLSRQKYIYTILRTCDDKVYINFSGLYVPEDAKNAWFTTIGFLMMDSNFKIMFAMVVMLSVNIRDITIIAVKNVDYHCTVHNISKSEANNLLKNSLFEDRGYI